MAKENISGTESRRKIVLINRQFQYRMIAKFIALNILIMIVFGSFLYLFLNSEIESNLQSAHVTYRNIKEMLFPIITSLSIVNILASSIVISVFVLYASFRIAGPMYRFNEAVKEISKKNLSPFTSIRKGDQLYECSLSLRKMSDVIANDFVEMNNAIQNMKKHASKKDKQMEQIENLEQIVNQYKI